MIVLNKQKIPQTEGNFQEIKRGFYHKFSRKYSLNLKLLYKNFKLACNILSYLRNNLWVSKKAESFFEVSSCNICAVSLTINHFNEGEVIRKCLCAFLFKWCFTKKLL